MTILAARTYNYFIIITVLAAAVQTMESIFVYGFAGNDKIVIATMQGSVAELVIPLSVSSQTRDHMRSSHMFKPVKMMVDKHMSWSSSLQAFECFTLSIPASTL